MAKSSDPFQLGEPAKQAMRQTQQAVDTYFEFLQKTILSIPTGETEFGEKAKSIAEQNITAAHEYIKKIEWRRGFSRDDAHTDRVHAGTNEGIWRAGEKSWRSNRESSCERCEESQNLDV